MKKQECEILIVGTLLIIVGSLLGGFLLYNPVEEQQSNNLKLDKIEDCNYLFSIGVYNCDSFDSLDKNGCEEKCYKSYGILSGEYVPCDKEYNEIRLICDGITKAIRRT